jgi:hypothetical protein
MREVRDGVRKLNEEGIQELLENTQDINTALKRKDLIIELGENYQTFSGMPKDCTGTVRFVVTTESIYQPKEIVPQGAESENPLDGQEAEEKQPNIFEQIWNWFIGLFGG